MTTISILFWVAVALLVIGGILLLYRRAFNNAPTWKRADDTPMFNKVLDELERKK